MGKRDRFIFDMSVPSQKHNIDLEIGDENKKIFVSLKIYNNI